MITNIIFILIGLILVITDMKYFFISNWIVIPAIVMGIALTGNWYWALIMLSIGALLFQYKFWAGGDVKLISMIGAFLGWKAIIILGISIVAIKIYQIKRNDDMPIPCSPFMIASSLLFLW